MYKDLHETNFILCIIFLILIALIILYVLIETISPLWNKNNKFRQGVITDVYKWSLISKKKIINRYGYEIKVGNIYILAQDVKNESILNIGDNVFVFNFNDGVNYCFSTEEKNTTSIK